MPWPLDTEAYADVSQSVRPGLGSGEEGPAVNVAEVEKALKEWRDAERWRERTTPGTREHDKALLAEAWAKERYLAVIPEGPPRGPPS